MKARSRRRSPRAAFRRTDLVVVIAILLVVASLVLPGIVTVRHKLHVNEYADNLRTIGKASHDAHDVIGVLPPAHGTFPGPEREGDEHAPSRGNAFFALLPYLQEGGVLEPAFRKGPSTMLLFANKNPRHGEHGSLWAAWAEVHWQSTLADASVRLIKSRTAYRPDEFQIGSPDVSSGDDHWNVFGPHRR